MANDPNAKINKAINKKLLDAGEWRRDAREAKRLGDPALARILEEKARKADADILKLRMKLK